MSTGCECLFIEAKPGDWYYVLEHTNAPKNAWDWRDNATAYGSFPSYEDARLHLSQNHANPGGYGKRPYVEGAPLDDVLVQLIKEARR